MRRLAAVAGLSVAALLFTPGTPASACDPNRFPNCQTYCGAIASRYREIQYMSERPLPDWPKTGVAGCP